MLFPCCAPWPSFGVASRLSELSPLAMRTAAGWRRCLWRIVSLCFRNASCREADVGLIQPSMAVCQNLAPLVNIKIAGKWMFIPLKMVLIGIDPYPYKDWNWSLSIVYPEMVDFQRNSCVSDMVPQCTPGEVFQALSS